MGPGAGCAPLAYSIKLAGVSTPNRISKRLLLRAYRRVLEVSARRDRGIILFICRTTGCLYRWISVMQKEVHGLKTNDSLRWSIRATCSASARNRAIAKVAEITRYRQSSLHQFNSGESPIGATKRVIEMYASSCARQNQWSDRFARRRFLFTTAGDGLQPRSLHDRHYHSNERRTLNIHASSVKSQSLTRG